MKRVIAGILCLIVLVSSAPIVTVDAKESETAGEMRELAAGAVNENGQSISGVYNLAVVPVEASGSWGWANDDYVVISILVGSNDNEIAFVPVAYRVKGDNKFPAIGFTRSEIGEWNITSYREVTGGWGLSLLGTDNGTRGNLRFRGGWSKNTCNIEYLAATTYTATESTNYLYIGDDRLVEIIEIISSFLLRKVEDGSYDKNSLQINRAWRALSLCIQCFGSNEELGTVGVQDEIDARSIEGIAEDLVGSRKEYTVLENEGGSYSLILKYTDAEAKDGADSQGLMFKVKDSVGYYTSLTCFSSLMNVILQEDSTRMQAIRADAMEDIGCMVSSPVSSHLDEIPKLYQMLYAYVGLNGACAARLAEQINEDSKTQVTKYTFAPEAGEFEKWSITFMKELAGEELGDENAAKVYNIRNFKKWYTDNADKLSVEEYLRLRTFYNLACGLSNIKNVTEEPALTSDWTYEKDVSIFGAVKLNERGYNQLTLRNNAVVVGKDTLYSITNNSVVNAVAKNFLDITKYYAAQAGGIQKKSSLFIESEEEEDIQHIDTNASLETMLNPDMLEGEGNGFVGLTWSSVPAKMLKLKDLVLTEEGYKAYETLQYALMLVNTYASSEWYSGIKESIDESGERTGVYINSDIEEYIKKWGGQEVVDSDNTVVYKYAKAYVAIADGLDYLGVEAFSPQLEALVKYAGWLRGVIDSNSIDISGEINVDAEPLSNFFSVESETFSYFYNLGVALSASYIPMQTNMYDVTSLVALDDPSFVEQFHYAYGFFRKALYIDTDVNAAVNLYVSGRVGSKRVATLRDLLDCERDIVLYIDDNFYNVDTLAEVQGLTYKSVLNNEETEGEADLLDTVKNAVSSFVHGSKVSAAEIVKTGGYSAYSDNIAKDVAQAYTKGANDAASSGYVLSSAEIDEYMTGYSENEADKVYNEYTPLQGYAVVSAVYKNLKLFNTVNSQSDSKSPVFISSPDLAGIEGVSRAYWNSIYNYIMLKNLPGNMSADYKTTLDMDSPLYMDIYGNILTESGLVVIPAAANSTLQAATSYDVHTAGFLTLADNGYYEIPEGFTNAERYAVGRNEVTGTTTGDFLLNEKSGTYQVAPKKINGIYYNFRDLPIGDLDVLVSLVNLHKLRLSTNENMLFAKRVYIITEVLRGAPLEWIDKQKEVLSAETLTKAGIYAAAKLEELSDALLSSSNGNSIVSLPNLAFMEHYEVVIMFLYKILFAVLIVVLFIKLYMDVVSRSFGVRSIFAFIATIVAFVIALFFIPEILNFSYYAANRTLLQDETAYIAALRLEKAYDGAEIGVTSVTAPKSNTVLYMKMDDIDVEWYNVVGKVLDVDTIGTMQEVYDEAVVNSIMAHLDGTLVRGNAVYMNIDDVFAATTMEYDSNKKALKNVTVKTPYASYVTPYYAILDCLVERVNDYNKKNNVYAFTTVVQSKGAVRTRGYVEAYFTSLLFMENSTDASTLAAVYGIDQRLLEASPFTASDLEKMKKSLWYSELSEEEMSRKLEELNKRAREFVAENYTILGKVTDETFLKAMAMYIAVEHNKLFHCAYGSSIEIFDVDMRDIVQLSLTDRASVWEGSSKSFARFVYDTAGTLGVVAAMFLIVVYFCMSIIKPVMMLLIMLTIVVTLGIRKLFRHDQEHVVEGFVISITLLCGINLLYALVLKLSMSLPKFGLSPLMSILVQIFIQVLYGGMMYLLLQVVLRDWRNLGFMEVQRKIQHAYVNSAVFDKMHLPAFVHVRDKTLAEEYSSSMRKTRERGRYVTKGLTGEDILDEIYRREGRSRRVRYAKRGRTENQRSHEYR